MKLETITSCLIGMIIMSLLFIYSLKVVDITSNGNKINNASVTIEILGQKINYYYE